MELLKRLMALKCNLIDYERIVNEKSQRLIFFSTHAGYAGMIETLVAFGQKMKLKGFDSPLAQIKQAFEYQSLEDAKEHIKQISCQISEKGLPEAFSPLVVGFAGDGNVSLGAQEIMDLLPIKEILPCHLDGIRNQKDVDRHTIYKVIFREQDMVKPLSGEFELQDYYDHPEKYESTVEQHLPMLDILVNCIFWTEKYPRLITKDYLKAQAVSQADSNLSVIGDISCDIEGSIEITKEATMPDQACYTYFAETDTFEEGIPAKGITVMAVDNLPCEFSKGSSMFFSNVLKEFANDIVCADFGKSFDDLDLPYPIKKALILHNGQFTTDYTFMEKFI
jgi:alpha-aminoadipic semialdehyde synthase